MKHFTRLLSYGSIGTVALTSTVFLSACVVLALHVSSASENAKQDSPQQVAQALDEFVQPRFQDDRAGVFGLTRIITPEQLAGVRGHQGLGVIKAKTPIEAALLDKVTKAKRDYLIAFVHCAHVPGHFHDTTSMGLNTLEVTDTSTSFTVLATRPPDPKHAPSQRTQQPQMVRSDSGLVPRDIDPKMYKQISDTTLQSLPKLKQGKSEEKVVGGWLVSMRPVKAEHESCLGCHVGAKKNDTLGAMVYVVKQQSYPIKS